VILYFENTGNDSMFVPDLYWRSW